MKKSSVESELGFQNIKMTMRNLRCSEGVFMDTVKELKKKELELLKLAELDPSDVIWTQRWTEGVQAVRQNLQTD